MTYRENLELKAAAYIDQYEPIPLDLFMEMQAEGMDVVSIEKQLERQRDSKENDNNG